MDAADCEQSGRIVALDYGRARVGVAASDPLRVIAKPRSVVDAGRPPTSPTSKLLEVLSELAPSVIVVGVPLNMDGSEGEMAKEAREFGNRVAEGTGVPVEFRDERLSSVEAERTIRELGLPRRKREARGLRDMLAAFVLLEDYMRETEQ